MDNKKILIVDDDCDMVGLIRLYLSKNGYRVLSAHDGPQALKAAREYRPDLILLDLMLPGLDGRDVCRLPRRVRRAHHHRDRLRAGRRQSGRA